jgi:hypothetical protein
MIIGVAIGMSVGLIFCPIPLVGFACILVAQLLVFRWRGDSLPPE